MSMTSDEFPLMNTSPLAWNTDTLKHSNSLSSLFPVFQFLSSLLSFFSFAFPALSDLLSSTHVYTLSAVFDSCAALKKQRFQT